MDLSESASLADTSATPGVPVPAPDVSLKAISSLLEIVDGARGDLTGPAFTEWRHQNQLVQVRLGMASSLFMALRAKHAPTAEHSLRVALGCSSWSAFGQLDERQRDEIEVAALLHDIGKIGVPDHVLLKPGRLTGDEFATMQRHRHLGVQILLSCCASQQVLDVVKYAPAWFDGSRAGFDRWGDDLPRAARMVAIIDAFDAMTTDQVYRHAMSRERATAELFAHAGTQFDPRLVAEFCEYLERDPARLDSQVTRRWLQDLQPARADAFWQLRQPVADDAQSVDSLYYEKLLNSMHDGVIFVDANRQILLWNRAAERITGIAAGSVAFQAWSPDLVELWDEVDREIVGDECPIGQAIRYGVQSLRRLTIQSQGGRRLSVDALMVPVIGRDGVTHGATILLHDASSEITLEKRVQSLQERATRDPLTGVANRAEFDRLLTQFVTTHLVRQRPCSLVICDLDHFKRVNDTYGHQAGDAALISFAKLLQRSCRTGDLVARYGGEEFVLLYADCGNAAATARAEEIRRELVGIPQPTLKGKSITASFGVTEIQAGDTPETMLRRADRGLLQAKAGGRNQVVQLGSGIAPVEPVAVRGWFQWIHGELPKQLIEQTLVTAVPMALAAEKLRGFIADHYAQILEIDGNRLVLKIDREHVPLSRRAGDRPVPFFLAVAVEEHYGGNPSSDPSQTVRTILDVAIRPQRSRDRRRRDAAERAYQLFASFKAYLMAQDSPLDAASRAAGGRRPSLDAWFGLAKI